MRVEFGSGVGAASLALLARVPGITVTMIEIDPVFGRTRITKHHPQRLSASARAVVLDAGAPRAHSPHTTLTATADHVFMNPPYNDATRPSPDGPEAARMSRPQRLLAGWIAAATVFCARVAR